MVAMRPPPLIQPRFPCLWTVPGLDRPAQGRAGGLGVLLGALDRGAI